MLAAKMGSSEPAPAREKTAKGGAPADAGGDVAGTLAGMLNSPILKIIAGRATTQVMRGLMGALVGTPRRRRR
jgi:hypothetical protein